MSAIPRIVLYAAFATASLVAVSPVLGETCGIVHKQARQPLGAERFRLLAEHRGRALVDISTCLVASTEVQAEPVTLSDAMQRCATLGQGGPRGEMGWQLPTMAELTSLDGEEWVRQGQELQAFDLPPSTRNESAFWTMTAWPGAENSYAAVTFSSRTTIVSPLAGTMKAGVWCVQATRATEVE